MPDMQVFPSRPVPPAAAATVVRRWFPHDRPALTPMTGGGFSGSPLFQVEAGGRHVLKAFPPGTSAARVRFVHAAVLHLRAHGVCQVPAVRLAADGESFVEDHHGTCWELQDFIVGESTATPTLGQVAAAMEVVARIHLAAASLVENPPDLGPSPGLARRIDQARGMLARPWAVIGTVSAASPPLAPLIRPLLDRAATILAAGDAAAVVAEVATLAPGPVARQTVLRDLWAPHVLYEGAGSDRVVGIVDCHAMGLDTPATDLARLLGSWAVESGFEDSAGWDAAIAAYARLRPLRDAERRAVPFLAASGVVFGLDNWFRWIFEDRRSFSDPLAVAARVQCLTNALPAALAMLGNTLPRARV